MGSSNFHRKIQQYLKKYEALGYGEDHLIFACHAAFPTGVTAHMLYQMWANFSQLPERNEPIDPVVISDFLLSSLCRETALGIFEMNPKIRKQLLDWLEKDPRFGKQRIKELAYFLYQYIQKSAQESDYDTFRETQYWTAISVISPQKAAQEIAHKLGQQIKKQDSGEIFRINNILEHISAQEKSFSNLLNYSRGLKEGLLDKPNAAKESFSKVMVVRAESEKREGFSLKIPLMKSVVSPESQFPEAPTAAEQEAEALIAEAKENGSRRLDLSNIEGLRKIPASIQELTDLEELYANNCDLLEIPFELSFLLDLKVLMLRHNHLQEVQGINLPLVSLVQLDLSYNKLKQFDPQIFLAPSLELINLDANELEILSPRILFAGEELKYLELRENPWLNLPLDFAASWSVPDLIKNLREIWWEMPTDRDVIKILATDYSQGDLFQDIQDSLRPWQNRVEVISVQAPGRYALYPRGEDFSNTHQGIPVLYITGEDLTMPIGQEITQNETLTPEILAKLLRPLSEITEVVVLNISEGLNHAGELLRTGGFKAVISSNAPLDERQRFQLQQTFFAAIAERKTIREAYEEANGSVLGSPLDLPEQNIQQQTAQSYQAPSFEPELRSSAWMTFEPPTGSTANWDWRLPDLEIEVEISDGTAEVWREQMKDLIKRNALDEVVDALRAQISVKDRLFVNLAQACIRYNFFQANENRDPSSSETAGVEQNRFVDQLLEIIEEVEPNGPIPESAMETEEAYAEEESSDSILQELIKPFLLADFNFFFKRFNLELQPNVRNFDYYEGQGMYKRLQDFIERGIMSLEESWKILERILQKLFSFLQDFDEDQLREDRLEEILNSEKAYFEYKQLEFLKEGKLIPFFERATGHYLIKGEQLNRYILSFSQLQKVNVQLQSGTLSNRDYFDDFQRITLQLKSLLVEINEEELNPNLLIEEVDFINNRIQSLEIQKAYDFQEVDQLKAELALVQEINLRNQPIEESTARAIYELIAKDRIEEAIESLIKADDEIKGGFQEELNNMQDSLELANRDVRNGNLDPESYLKSRTEFCDNLLSILYDMGAGYRETTGRINDPDLLAYLQTQVDYYITNGAAREAASFLLFALDFNTEHFETAVRYSNALHRLVNSQERKWKDYREVLNESQQIGDELRKFSYSGIIFLQPNFVTDEIKRVQALLNQQSSIGKSKRFDNRRSSESKHWGEALAFLQKYS